MTYKIERKALEDRDERKQFATSILLSKCIELPDASEDRAWHEMENEMKILVETIENAKWKGRLLHDLISSRLS